MMLLRHQPARHFHHLAAWLLTIAVLISVGGAKPADDADEVARAKLLGVLVYTKVSMKLDDTPAREAIKALREALGIAVVGRWSDDSVGFGMHHAHHTRFAGCGIRPSALEQILEQAAVAEECSWQLRHGFIEVGTKDRLAMPAAREVRMEIGGMPFVSPHEKPTGWSRCGITAASPTRSRSTCVLARARDRHPARRRRHVSCRRRSADTAATGARRPARVVIATGAYDVPNPLDVPGEDLPHVSHYYREPHSHYRRNVVDRRRQELRRRGGARALSRRRDSRRSCTAARRSATRSNTGSSRTSRTASRRAAIGAHFSTRVAEITATDVVLDGPGGQSRPRSEPSAADRLSRGPVTAARRRRRGRAGDGRARSTTRDFETNVERST